MTRVSDEVLASTGDVVTVNRQDLEGLKRAAAASPRKRFRLCAHQSVVDDLHEMVVVLSRETYVRPHKHLGKSESFHLVEGELLVVLFDEAGAITQVIAMSPPTGGGSWFYRLSASRYHAVMPLSEMVVFHETTNGPFRREDTVWAPWAPAEEDRGLAEAYVSDLLARAQGMALA